MLAGSYLVEKVAILPNTLQRIIEPKPGTHKGQPYHNLTYVTLLDRTKGSVHVQGPRIRPLTYF